MSDKEDQCDKIGTGSCPIIDDLYSLQDKYHKLQNEKSDIERKLEDLRKTIANNTFSYPNSYIEYITEVVDNVRAACKCIMSVSVVLCMFALLIGIIEAKQPDGFVLEAFGSLGILVVVLTISALGYITIPDKYMLSGMINDYIQHKKAEKVAEFYRLFPLSKEEFNDEKNQRY